MFNEYTNYLTCIESECLDTVDWVTWRASCPWKPLPLILKDSVQEEE